MREKHIPHLFIPSEDGINQNILILFHGIGDEMTNFSKFGRKLQLPQTALLCIQGTHPLFFGEPGHVWFPAFDQETGDELDPLNPNVQSKIQDSKKQVIQLIISTVKQIPNNIFVLGFGQGGTFALEVGRGLEDKLGLLGGIISISGFPFPSSKEFKTPALITFDKNSTPPSHLSTNIELFKVETKECIQMPKDKLEMNAIFSFLGKRLALRNLMLESHPDVHEIK